jgi:hypothetical protein
VVREPLFRFESSHTVPCLKVPLDLEIAPFFFHILRKYHETTAELLLDILLLYPEIYHCSQTHLLGITNCPTSHFPHTIPIKTRYGQRTRNSSSKQPVANQRRSQNERSSSNKRSSREQSRRISSSSQSKQCFFPRRPTRQRSWFGIRYNGQQNRKPCRRDG